MTSLTRAGRLWSSADPAGGDLDLHDFTVTGDELFYRFGNINRVHIGRVEPRPPVFR